MFVTRRQNSSPPPQKEDKILRQAYSLSSSSSLIYVTPRAFEFLSLGVSGYCWGSSLTVS